MSVCICQIPLKDIQLESLSREDLVNLVRKQLLEKNEAQEQLETIKKEAEESAGKQAQV
jgi:uncharacterized protein YfeS